ncbi:MAG: hypothetical protein M1819_005473 [Sarea resinae]|nr:MAG: hypothetical protein M1819_005473 [Sarea resinae]
MATTIVLSPPLIPTVNTTLEYTMINSSSPGLPSPSSLISRDISLYAGARDDIGLPRILGADGRSTTCLIPDQSKRPDHRSKAKVTRRTVLTPIKNDKSRANGKALQHSGSTEGSKRTSALVKKPSVTKSRTSNAVAGGETEASLEASIGEKQRAPSKSRKGRIEAGKLKTQKSLEKGKITKPGATRRAKKESLPDKVAVPGKVTGKVSEFFGCSNTSKESNTERTKPVETGEDFPPNGVIRRRRSWTPPKDTFSGASSTSVAADNTWLSLGDPQLSPETHGFGDLLSNFGSRRSVETAKMDHSDRTSGAHMSTKRRRIELVQSTAAFSKLEESAPNTRKKGTMGRKKAQTITKKATAQYTVQGSPTFVTPPSLLQYFGDQDKIPQSQLKIQNVDNVGRARKTKNASHQTTSNLLTPESALKVFDGQDLLFGTSSQLATEESPAFIRDLQQAMNASEAMLVHESGPSLSAESNSTGTSGVSSFIGNRSLWSAASRDPTGCLHGVEVIDLADSPVARQSQDPHPEKTEEHENIREKGQNLVFLDRELQEIKDDRKINARAPIVKSTANTTDINGSSNSRSVPPVVSAPSKSKANKLESSISSDDSAVRKDRALEIDSNPEKPNYAGFTAAQLSRELASYGFKPVKNRERMIQLLGQCWEGKQRAALQALRQSQQEPEHPIECSTSVQEAIEDSESERTPSPPRYRSAPARTEPLPLCSLADDEVQDQTRFEAESYLIHQITRAITTESPTHHSDRPSWHEKILLYDPIVLEDLAAWLNTEGLTRVGVDQEVGPAVVRKWCEERGVCCLWKANLKGAARARIVQRYIQRPYGMYRKPTSQSEMTEKATMAGNTERTPLLENVAIAPRHHRYPHSSIRRFCTALLATSLFVVIVLFLVPFALDARPHWPQGYPHASWPQSEGLSFSDLEETLLATPEESKAREWSQYYTAGPHLAGKNLSQAIWTKDRWQEFGISQTEIIAYDVYINYPAGHRLALLEKAGSSQGETAEGTEAQWKVKFEASLEEDVLEEDSTSGLNDRIPTFHGYSASGNVTAPYVYVNYGTYQDFEDLLKANVSLSGKIALIKYGGIFRGLKVKRAQELGMVGAIIYSDPGDDGETTELNGNETYPKGPAREPSSVQRGSTQFLSVAPGDPTTPGYPSKPGVPRQDTKGAIPSIPSIPISYLDALPLLKALNGHGPKASSINKWWKGGGLRYKGVEYNIGPSPEGFAVNLVNEQEYVTTPLWNVIGIINGTIPDEVVILGNHRDAWIAGGAGDPNSGSAALNEVVRSFGKALSKGWRPLRTIVFASWDGEEYGLIGSTEWVEEYLPWLSESAVAYLNVDVGARGTDFGSSASPLLNKALYKATSSVRSPNQTINGQTVRDTWNGHIKTMGSGSDFTAFQDFAGIPSVDMGFSAGPKDAIYHYHSNYDSFSWMDRFGDPGFHYHVAITKVWSLFAARLSETPVLRLNATDYADGLKGYLQRAETKKDEKSSLQFKDHASSTDVSFEPLEHAIKRLHSVSAQFDSYATSLERSLKEGIPWWKWWQKAKIFYEVRKVNKKYKLFERQFLYQTGLDGRPWFKHVVFAPGLWTGYC